MTSFLSLTGDFCSAGFVTFFLFSGMVLSDVGALFISDSAYSKGGNYCHSRFCLHSRCIQFLESFLNTGSVDCSINRQYSGYELKSDHLEAAYSTFKELMHEKRLSNNTIDSYNRFVRYFFQYLEDKKYTKLEDIQKGDIIEFVSLISTEYYSPTSLGAHWIKTFAHIR